ncbi:ABC transporter ATP-binding protein [Rhizocola hellebori]|uniref:ABC transporter ATP-binding protein n=1 Tax=Rhizocola hellebori TaxID=1392758 RepID=A0A8J3QGJ2_9ACTN|nr:ABC transporter ATP-binding protein [Rhizocola hellebori]GIH08916.1 ABC transporter ATP-binding protein [Rhizocola hellebori]
MKTGTSRPSTALETAGLGHRYRQTWALRDCALHIPAGRVAALVGPNGAGKSTLLHIVVGLLTPTTGNVDVLGEPVGQQAAALSRVAFMAQDKPLYEGFTVADILRFGRHLNPQWDNGLAENRLNALGIALKSKVGKLSGGQQAQVALTAAIAKRPHLIVLDEPLANLDPLARNEVMRSLMTEVAETEITVLLSSHVVSDLEDTCDWLILLNGGRVQLCGDIEELLSSHRMISGPVELADRLLEEVQVIDQSRTARQLTCVARIQTSEPVLHPDWSISAVNLEQLVLAYLRRPNVGVLPHPNLASA